MSDKVENRNRAVLEAAIALAQERGFSGITRDAVAERAGVAAGSVNNAYGDMNGLRDAVMASAIRMVADGELHNGAGVVSIVAQGLAAGHPAAANAPPNVKTAALAALAA